MKSLFHRLTCFIGFFLAVFTLKLSLTASDLNLDQLIKALASEDNLKRSQAKNQLVAFYQEEGSAFLIPYLTSSSKQDQIVSLELAALIGPSSKVMREIEKLLTSSDSFIRLKAVQAWRAWNTDRAAQALSQALRKESDSENIAEILQVLSRNSNYRPQAQVGGFLTDENLKVRYAASQVLWRRKPSGFESEVVQAVRREKDRQVKAYLLAYLVTQSHEKGADLKDYILDSDRVMRQLVREAYQSARDTSVISGWIQAMTNKSWRIRLDAAQGFLALSEPKHVDQLLSFLQDPHPEVRDVVGQALRRVTQRSFGYQGHASEANRQTSVKKWKAWWQDNAYLYDVSKN